MLESKDIEITSENRPGPVFDTKSIPVHTMQNDLDMLSGKIKPPVEFYAEEKNINTGTENSGSAMNMSGGRATNSSPFMENTTPVPSSAPIFPSPVSLKSFPSSNPNPLTSQKSDSFSNVPTSSLEKSEKPSNSGKLVGILAGVVIFLGALGGGYYFYMTRYNVPTPEVEVVVPEVIPEVVPEPEVVVTEKFSADKPNYLLIDVENMAVGDIQKLFIQKASEIKEDKKTTPIEFVITDANNNPIALKIFALLMKVSFSPKLSADFQDEFSVYIFPGEEGVRLGLSILPKDAAKAFVDMKVEEKVLIKNLGTLFLGETAKSQEVSFQDAQYNSTAIRYINLNTQKTLSVDYFRGKDRLILATSKKTSWAIIDKIEGQSQN